MQITIAWIGAVSPQFHRAISTSQKLTPLSVSRWILSRDSRTCSYSWIGKKKNVLQTVQGRNEEKRNGNTWKEPVAKFTLTLKFKVEKFIFLHCILLITKVKLFPGNLMVLLCNGKEGSPVKPRITQNSSCDSHGQIFLSTRYFESPKNENDRLYLLSINFIKLRLIFS